MLSKASLDISNVNQNVAGDYVILCNVGDEVYTYDIHIIDTIAPTFTLSENNDVYGTYVTYPIESLTIGATIDDLSNVNDIELVSCKNEDGNIIDISNNEFLFENTGFYTFEFEVSDICGNSTRDSVSIEVLESPHFELLNDRQYKIGSDYELLDFVYAYDRNGNDITNEICVVDTDGFDTNVPDTYNITYSVVDVDGIIREESITIEVGDFEQNDFGFENVPENIQLLIDHDYFKYEPLVGNNDTDIAVDLTKYTSFGLKDETGYGAEAFIYKITPNYVYMMTNKHCHSIYGNKEYLYFVDYDDNIIEIENNDNVSMTLCSDYDIEIIKIPTNDFDLCYLLTYKEVFVDWDIYNKMNIGDKLIINSQAFGYESFDTLKDKISIGCISSFYTNNINGGIISGYFLLASPNVCVHGQSGSPTFNINGGFLGVTTSILSYDGVTATKVIALNDIKKIVDAYEFE